MRLSVSTLVVLKKYDPQALSAFKQLVALSKFNSYPVVSAAFWIPCENWIFAAMITDPLPSCN